MCSRSGGGLSLPSRASIRGSASSSARQPRPDGPEVVAVLVEVALEPAGADPEDRAAAGDVVDGAVGVGEVLGVAVGVADHQRAELDALGHLGHRAEHGQRLEVVAVRVAPEREEVVPVEQAVDAHLLGLGPRAAHRRPVGVLRLELGGDAE